jgi:hypothetical protein
VELSGGVRPEILEIVDPADLVAVAGDARGLDLRTDEHIEEVGAGDFGQPATSAPCPRRPLFQTKNPTAGALLR